MPYRKFDKLVCFIKIIGLNWVSHVRESSTLVPVAKWYEKAWCVFRFTVVVQNYVKAVIWSYY